jgi:hypothetical protein
MQQQVGVASADQHFDVVSEQSPSNPRSMREELGKQTKLLEAVRGPRIDQLRSIAMRP